ncbi:hypothetical protein LOK49_LG05G00181 [Camellia lanceoleosa]|uniref:Uncharacterized protein n=1 Tax=Camellia lanceoleosa TaxID=1840588 RepID=A0ACC0HMU3_9ERIC|nr:hypothetical protein LOK49_LG05G00181 [Camellia lanceoleosa]
MESFIFASNRIESVRELFSVAQENITIRPMLQMFLSYNEGFFISFEELLISDEVFFFFFFF